MGGRVDVFTARGVIRRSVIPDCVEDPVRGDLMIGVADIEPEAIEVERFCVVLIG